MQKAIFSRYSFYDDTNEKGKDFLLCIEDLLDHICVQQLDDYYQHLNTSRLQHSINVAYYTYLACRKYKLNYVSATRGALLHDLYHYDWKKKEQPCSGRHSCVHPRIALETAKFITEVDAIMEDAIVHHMWPMSFSMPKTKEGWIVQAMDKYCAILELLLQSGRIAKFSKAAAYLMVFCTFSFS